MKRKLLAVLLTAAMILYLLPAGALAAEGDQSSLSSVVEATEDSGDVPAANPEADGTYRATEDTTPLSDVYVSSNGSDDTGDGTSDTPFATLEKALDNVNTGGTIHVMSDLSLSESVTVNNISIVGDSDGDLNDGETFTITRTSDFSDAMLTVTGGSVTLTGVMFNGNGDNINATNTTAGNIYTGTTGIMVSGGSLTIGNGAGLTNSKNMSGTATWTSGGVKVTGSGTVTLNEGGSITNNTSNDGGGVLAYAGGTLIMNGGTISGNTATNGPAVYVAGTSSATSKLELNGGTITNNYGTRYGGGVMVHEHSNATIGSVTVKYNGVSENVTSAAGDQNVTVTTYEDNTNINHTIGAGILIYRDSSNTSNITSTVTLTGAPNITDNYVSAEFNKGTHEVSQGSGTESNLGLSSGQTVKIEGLTSGANIGVYTAVSPNSTADVQIATGASDANRAYFHSDKQDSAGVIYCDGTGDSPVTGKHTCSNTTSGSLYLSTAAAGAASVKNSNGTDTMYTVDSTLTENDANNHKYTSVESAISAALADAANDKTNKNTVTILENPEDDVSEKKLASGDTVVSGSYQFTAEGSDATITVKTDGSVKLDSGTVKVDFKKQVAVFDPNSTDGTATMTLSTLRDDGMTVIVGTEGTGDDAKTVVTAHLSAADQGVDITGGALDGVKILSNEDGDVYFTDPIGKGCQVRLPANESYNLKINDNATITAVTGGSGVVKVDPDSSGLTLINVPAGMQVTIKGKDGTKTYPSEAAGEETQFYVTADGDVAGPIYETEIYLNEGNLGSLTYLSGGMVSYQLPNALVLGVTPPKTFEVSVDNGYFKVGSASVGDGVTINAALTSAGKVVTGLDTSTAYTYVSFTVTGKATTASLQAWLRGVTFYKDKNADQNVTARGENVELTDGVQAFMGHYYKFVQDNNISWSDAYKEAKNSTFNGLQGYLITVTGQQEHDYIYQKFGKNGWMAATRAIATNGYDGAAYSYSGTTYGWNWYWACGPEAGESIGKQNANGKGMASVETYANWTSGEPNGKSIPNSSYEGFGQYGYRTGGLWNDLPDRASCGGIQGYYVEYSEYGTQTAETPAAADTRAVIAENLNPMTITYSASNGSATLTVSPTISGCKYVVVGSDGKVVDLGDVDYVEGDPDDGEITISGLTSGGTYQVVAVADGADVSAGTPLTPSDIVQTSTLVTLATPVSDLTIEQTQDTVTGEGGEPTTTNLDTISITLQDARNTGTDYALIDQTTGAVIGWETGKEDGVTFSNLDPSHSYAAVSATHPAGGTPLLAEGATPSLIYPAPLFDEMSAEYDENAEKVTVTVENPVEGAEYWAVLTNEDGTTEKVKATVANDGTVTISGLKPGTEYTIVAAADESSVSAGNGTTITTPSAPSTNAGTITRTSVADVAEKTRTDTITVSDPDQNLQYALVDQNGNYIDQDGSISETPIWLPDTESGGESNSLAWSGLDPSTAYTVLTMSADATDNVFPTEEKTLDPTETEVIAAGYDGEKGATVTVGPADSEKLYALLDSNGKIVQNWTKPTAGKTIDNDTYTVTSVMFSGLELGTTYEVVSTKDSTSQPEAGSGVKISTPSFAELTPDGGTVKVSGITVTAPAKSDTDGNTGTVTVTAAVTDDEPANIKVAKSGDSFTANGVDFTAGKDGQVFNVEDDGTVTVTLEDGESVTINGVTYTGPTNLNVDKDGNITNYVTGTTAKTITIQGVPGAEYTVKINGESKTFTADETTGKVTISGLEKNTQYTISSKYGSITATTSAVDAAGIAKAFDENAADSSGDDDQITENESSKVTVTVDENGNYKVTLKEDITAEDTGATNGNPTVTVGDNWGSVTVDLAGHTISGSNATENSAATAGLAFTHADNGETGTGTSLTITSSVSSGKIVGGNGSAGSTEENVANGASGISANESASNVTLTLESKVTVTGGSGADGSGDSDSGGNGGAGVSGSLSVTVAGATIKGGNGGSATGENGTGGEGGSGVSTTGSVTVTSGTLTGGNGGSATGEYGTGGAGGSGVSTTGSVTVTGGTLTGGNGGSAAGEDGTGGAGGSGLDGDGTITGGTVTNGSSAEGAAALPTLSATSSSIKVSNAAPGTIYYLYDSQGNEVGTATAGDSGTVTFSGLSSNTTYIVKASDDGTASVVGAIKTSSSSSGASGGTDASSGVSGAGKITGGTVSVSPATPEAGATVTVTLSPDSGYVPGGLKVLDGSGNSLPLTANGDGTYSFTMPSGTASIDASFRLLATGCADCPKNSTCPVAAFSDADPTAWYHNGVHFCIENRLMVGISATTFAPNKNVSRAMVATILWRLQGSPVVSNTLPYKDVPAGTYYTEAVRWASSQGIVSGYGNGKFGPNDSITREQLASMLYRYARYAGWDVTAGADDYTLEFNDASSVSRWALPAMRWACASGVIKGKTDGILDPRGTATRAQTCVIIANLYDVV